MKTINIGVIGSSGKLMSQPNKEIAKELGQKIAQNKLRLLFGYEDDVDSLSKVAALESLKNKGEAIAFVRGSKKFTDDLEVLQVVTGMERGGGREFSLVLSSDLLIVIGGGSGTLGEITIAYQAKIPIISINGTGGWSDRLSGGFLDERENVKIHRAQNAKDAVSLILKILK